MKSYVLVLAFITLAKGIAFAAHSDGSFDRSLTVSGPVDLDVKTDSVRAVFMCSCEHVAKCDGHDGCGSARRTSFSPMSHRLRVALI
jgi:hypothetical protein